MLSAQAAPKKKEGSGLPMPSLPCQTGRGKGVKGQPEGERQEAGEQKFLPARRENKFRFLCRAH